MGALLTLLVIAGVSLVVVKMGAAALSMTGMSAHAASFQAYSAFFGVGFTTREAEMVMSHRVRRRIIRDLILAGNIGLTSALATLVATFVQSNEHGGMAHVFGWLLLGALGFWLVTRTKWVNRFLEWSIRRALEKLGDVRSMDYEPLLKVEAGFCIAEFEVAADNLLAGRTIAESHPTDIGIVILGISKLDGGFVGAPGPKDRIEIGDSVTVYGHEEAIRKIREPKQSAVAEKAEEAASEDGGADRKGGGKDEDGELSSLADAVHDIANPG